MEFQKFRQFLDYAKSKNVFAGNTVNSWGAALSSVEAVLTPDEQTIEFIKENSLQVKNRLQNANHNLAGQTIDVYMQRIQLALKHFDSWSADRSKWEREVSSKASGRSERTSSGKNSEKPNRKSDPAPGNNSRGSRQATTIPVPTASGEGFSVTLPEQFTVSDIVRVAWALAVYASDFDPETVLRRFGKPEAYYGGNKTGRDGSLPSNQ